jgi:hypothetical protein
VCLDEAIADWLRTVIRPGSRRAELLDANESTWAFVVIGSVGSNVNNTSRGYRRWREETVVEASADALRTGRHLVRLESEKAVAVRGGVRLGKGGSPHPHGAPVVVDEPAARRPVADGVVLK